MNESAKFFKLTNTIYALSEFIPDETLKNKIRNRALEVFSNLSLIFSENPEANDLEQNDFSIQVERDIEVLQGYLELAKYQNFLHSFNFLIVKNEYDKIKGLMQKYQLKEKKIKETTLIQASNKLNKLSKQDSSSPISNDIPERQQKILKILKEKGKAQVSDLLDFFQNITKRTLRRDLRELMDKKLIKRQGSWNQVFYKPNMG